MQSDTNNIGKRLFILGCSIFLIGFFNCSQIVFAQPLDPSLPGYEQVKPPERPIVKIISPQIGSSVLGPKVTLEYLLSGIKLKDPKILTKNIKGEGHLKITFARKGYPVPTPIVVIKNSPLLFEKIPEGKYRITIEIVKNSGRSYNPPILDTTKFEVILPKTPIPTPEPTSTPIPIPLYKKVQPSLRQILFVFGIFFLILPVTFFIRK